MVNRNYRNIGRNNFVGERFRKVEEGMSTLKLIALKIPALCS